MKNKTLRALAALALATAAAATAGCGAIEKIDQMQLAQDRETCAKYGFAPNTDPFAACMQRTATERQRRFDAQSRANMNAGEKKPEPKMDCKTTEVVSTSADGTQTTTNSRTSCIGM